MLKIYSYYRFALALLLLGMYFAFAGAGDGIPLIRTLYLGTAIPFAILNLVTLVAVLLKPRHPRPRHLFLMFVLDIAALALITHASGGINSGFAILLIVTVTAAAIFLPGQIGTLIAAVASIAVLSESVWRVLVRDAGVGSLFPAGMLGMLLFASSILVQRLAVRMEHSEELAQRKAAQVLELQQLNQLIVQRMRTGILFLDADDRVRLANRAASVLLGISEREVAEGHGRLPGAILEQLKRWRNDSRTALEPTRLREDGPVVQLVFVRTESTAGDGTLVFAEDFSQIARQAQQLKLASLGRLTASIAHEIRNPLGAISHAAQLLRESPQLGGEDSRLVDIVIGNATRTNEVIESVLTMSRGTPPKPKSLPLAQWLREYVAELSVRESAMQPEITLDVEAENVEVSVDPTHLRQVMNNLCENGLRYSRRATGRSSLGIRIHLDSESDSGCLDIMDQGEGISAQNAMHIFEPFFTTEKSGTGLGLYLSSVLCEANQVRLEYRRPADGGSCFRLSFPHFAPRIATENGYT